jgi:hypothetical protein
LAADSSPQPAPWFFFSSSLLLRSVCALQKKTRYAPTHRGRDNGHAAAA